MLKRKVLSCIPTLPKPGKKENTGILMFPSSRFKVGQYIFKIMLFRPECCLSICNDSYLNHRHNFNTYSCLMQINVMWSQCAGKGSISRVRKQRERAQKQKSNRKSMSGHLTNNPFSVQHQFPKLRSLGQNDS